LLSGEPGVRVAMTNGRVTAFAKFIQWLMLLQLLAAHDCWRECGGRGGLCELFCGPDAACCRGGWAQDPVECGAALSTLDPNGHLCVPVNRAHADNCWPVCNEKSGHCDACGLGKACCKAGFPDSPEECKGATFSLYHKCIDAPPKMCEVLGVTVPCSTVTFSSTTRTTTILTTTTPMVGNSREQQQEHHASPHQATLKEDESGFPQWAWPLIFLPVIIAALMIPLLMGSYGCWPTNQKRDLAPDVFVDEDNSNNDNSNHHYHQTTTTATTPTPEELHPRSVDGAHPYMRLLTLPAVSGHQLQGSKMGGQGPNSAAPHLAAFPAACPTVAPGPYLMR